MLNNILLQIKEKKAFLPLSEKKIAEVILKDPVSVINMNSSLLAKKPIPVRQRSFGFAVPSG